MLEAASELFYWHGIRATGVDAVAAAAGVAPTTLYRLFASKNDLVAAYVERKHRIYRAWFTETVQAGGPEPRDQLLAFFDALIGQVQPDICRGCPYQMTLAEVPESDLPAHARAIENKTWLLAQLRLLTDALGVADPATLATLLMVLTEGVYASAQSLGADGPARATRAFVETLLPAP